MAAFHSASFSPAGSEGSTPGAGSPHKHFFHPDAGDALSQVWFIEGRCDREPASTLPPSLPPLEEASSIHPKPPQARIYWNTCCQCLPNARVAAAAHEAQLRGWKSHGAAPLNSCLRWEAASQHHKFIISTPAFFHQLVTCCNHEAKEANKYLRPEHSLAVGF